MRVLKSGRVYSFKPCPEGESNAWGYAFNTCTSPGIVPVVSVSEVVFIVVSVVVSVLVSAVVYVAVSVVVFAVGISVIYKPPRVCFLF